MKSLLLALLLTAPIQEKVTVYFYRLEEAPRAMRGKPKLRINGKEVATFPEREYIGVRLKLGRYVLTLGQPQSATALVVEAGKTYYVQVSHKPGGHGFSGLVDEIILRDEAQALLHLEGMKPMGAKNIKDRTLEVVREGAVRH